MAEKDTEPYPIDPPIEVDIPGYSEKTLFHTWVEFTDFIEGECTAWQWLSENTGLPEPLGDTGNLHWRNLVDLKNWSEQITGQPGHSDNSARRQRIENGLSQYRKGDLVFSKSPDGQYIISLAETDPRAAIGALASLGTQNFPLHQQTWRDVLRGATQLAVSRIDKKGAVARATRALNELRGVWGIRLDEQRTSFESLQADGISQQKAIDAEQMRVAQVWGEHEEKAEEFFQGARQEKDDLERTFTEHMRLEAPTKYWTDKATDHLLWAAVAFVAFAALSGGAAKLLFDNAPEILALVTPAKSGDFPLGNIVVISLPALAFFWFLRFVSRIFVTNLQRRDDALERATMVNTYLALMSEGETVAGPDERILILNALFRPGPGDAPDMAPPADLLEIIKRSSR